MDELDLSVSAVFHLKVGFSLDLSTSFIALNFYRFFHTQSNVKHII